MGKNYEQIYKNMGIRVLPLDENYNPEEYGRELMRGTDCSYEVVYSTSTDYNQQAERENQQVVFA